MCEFRIQIVFPDSHGTHDGSRVRYDFVQYVIWQVYVYQHLQYKFNNFISKIYILQKNHRKSNDSFIIFKTCL